MNNEPVARHSNEPDFSALHDDVPEETSAPDPHHGSPRPFLSRGVSLAIGVSAIIVAISAAVVAGASVYYVHNRPNDSEQLVAALANLRTETMTRPVTPAPSSAETSSASESSEKTASGGSSSEGSSSGGGSQGVRSAVDPVDEDGQAATAQSSDTQGDGSEATSELQGPEWVDGVLVLRMAEPRVDDFAAQFEYLIDPNTPDAGIRANMDAGAATVPAGRLLQKSVQMNQTNNWQWSFRGPVNVNGDTATVHFVNSANGWPETDKELVFRKIDGNWKYSRETVCSYLAASGGAEQCAG